MKKVDKKFLKDLKKYFRILQKEGDAETLYQYYKAITKYYNPRYNYKVMIDGEKIRHIQTDAEVTNEINIKIEPILDEKDL